MAHERQGTVAAKARCRIRIPLQLALQARAPRLRVLPTIHLFIIKQIRVKNFVLGIMKNTFLMDTGNTIKLRNIINSSYFGLKDGSNAHHQLIYMGNPIQYFQK